VELDFEEITAQKTGFIARSPLLATPIRPSTLGQSASQMSPCISDMHERVLILVCSLFDLEQARPTRVSTRRRTTSSPSTSANPPPSPIPSSPCWTRQNRLCGLQSVCLSTYRWRCRTAS
jgi:hypothetical protein